MASVRMPQLGESITEGTISKWLKKPGDQVKKYEGLVEIITDKVNAEVPSPLAGTLREIKVPEGETVSVGTEIAVIDEVAAPPKIASPLTGETQHVPSPPMIPSPNTPSPSEVGAGVLITPAPGRPPEAFRSGKGGGVTRLSPAVRALVDEHHLSDADLAVISGSGIGGRISKKDVEEYVAKGRQPILPSRPTDEPIALTPMRRAIAINMLKSKQTIPHAWTVTEVDMTAVVRERERAKDAFKQREGVDLTFVPIVIKGVVESLHATPILNASWAEDHVVLHRDINIGVAVSIDDGLIVPVIKNADQLSIARIARAVDDLARRARAGKLTLEDVQGATFTLNNPGTFGTVLSYSIIAPPQAAILAMDAIIRRPVVVEGDAIAIRSMMNLCLSFDHRVLDGVSAARFLRGVRRFLEEFSEKVPLS